MTARVPVRRSVLGVVALLAVLAACAPSAAPARRPASAPPSVPAAASSAGSSGSPAAAPAAPVAAPAALLPMKIAFSQVAAAFAPIWIAHDEGVFKKHGLDSEVVHLTKPTDIGALVSGEVQFTVDGSSGIEAIAGGANLTYIAVPLPIYTQALYGQPGVEKVSDLVGKNVGVTSQGGSSDNALKTLLMKEGVDLAQINTLYLRDDANILAAIQNGTVQAANLTSPNTLRARQAGLREIVDFVPRAYRTINTGIITRKDWAQQNPELVERFLKAYMEASKIAKTNPEVTKPIISKRTQLDDQVLLDESYRNSQASWVIYPLIRDADIQNVIDVSTTPDVRNFKPADYYDNSYLQRLEAFARGLEAEAGTPTR